jgi:hypothetical protein
MRVADVMQPGVLTTFREKSPRDLLLFEAWPRLRRE